MECRRAQSSPLHRAIIQILFLLLLPWLLVSDAQAQCNSFPHEVFPVPDVISGNCFTCSTAPETIVKQALPSGINVTFTGGFFSACGTGYVTLNSGPTCSPLPNTINISFSKPVSHVELYLSNFRNTQVLVTDNLGNSKQADLGTFLDGPGITSLTISATAPDWFFGVNKLVFTPDVSATPVAGTITVSPNVGVPGTEVTVTGSGWVNPTGSQFQILFDGNPISGAVQGPLACADQPNIKFNIPCPVKAGSHTIVCQQGSLSSPPVQFDVPRNFALTTPCSAPPKVTFRLAKDKMALPSAFRVGIPYGVALQVLDSDGTPVIHDRRVALEVVVDPPSARVNLILLASAGLIVDKVKNVGKDIISFELTGVEESFMQGDRFIEAINPDGIVARQTITVVVPWQVGTHNPTTSSNPNNPTIFNVTPFNQAANLYTIVPAFLETDPNAFNLRTNYFQPFVIKVLDKWGMEIGKLYDDSLIFEVVKNPDTGEQQDVNINVRLGVTPDQKKTGFPAALIPTVPSSAYVDYVGGGVLYRNISGATAKKRAADFEKSTDYQPLDDDIDGTDEIPIKVDGFLLQPSPAITKRHVVIRATKDPNGNPIVKIPTPVMIDWP